MVAGESMNPDGMTVLLRWDEETPYMYFFKDGLIEEKVVCNFISKVFDFFYPYQCGFKHVHFLLVDR